MSRAASLALGFGLCLALAALSGCGGSVSGGDLMGSGGSGASGGSGGSGTGGSGATGGSGGGPACGPITCKKGEQCCDANCGMCAPMGAMCPAVACAPVDAGPPVPCGSTTCAAGEYCCSPSCNLCEPNGAECPQMACAADAGPTHVPCGNTFCSPGSVCCDICGSQSCVTGNTCPTGGACTVDCAPQDTQGYGKCNMLLGYAWNGGSCVPIGGCSCQGTDCGSLFQDYQSCIQAYASCPQYYN